MLQIVQNLTIFLVYFSELIISLNDYDILGQINFEFT